MVVVIEDREIDSNPCLVCISLFYGSMNIQAIRWTANARANGAKLYSVNEDTILPRTRAYLHLYLYVCTRYKEACLKEEKKGIPNLRDR